VTAKDLVGRRVRIIAWEHLAFAADYRRRPPHADGPEGTVTDIEAFGDGDGDGDDDGDVWVRIDEIGWAYAFRPDQLEILPPSGGEGP
jgi:hypothetical protein